MNATIKALIVWLVLLTVPLQGFASATRMWCAPPAAAQPHAAVHAAADTASTDGRPAGAHLRSASDAACAVDHHCQPRQHHDGKCNTCATCCVGASMPPSFALTLPVSAPQFEFVPFAHHDRTAPDLALPERPPRA